MSEYIKRKYEFDDRIADFLCERYGFRREFSEILAGRGVSAENAAEFFNPTDASFHDPFLMPGMRDAVGLIKEFPRGRALIYGDYDCDGVTASAILKLYFDSIGLKNRVLLPSRSDGYGLHYSLVEKAYFEEAFDFLITVDCGISAREEVTKITECLGVKVIITDHHNLPDVLPDCVCVNPKLGYPYPYLSGAGVAFKLIQALGGLQAAGRFFGLAATGTAGDVCPLSGENRAIISLGLKSLKHRGLVKLAESVNCLTPMRYSDLVMRICPRINAAGRVGTPEPALKVCLSEKAVRESDIQTLNRLNEERVALQGKLFEEIEESLKPMDLAKRNCIVLRGDRWHKGILGITASRIKEVYNMPTFIFRREGDIYYGSARSIEGADIFAAAKGVGSIMQFGGHSLSMGLSVRAEDFERFDQEIDIALSRYKEIISDRSYYYDLEFDEYYLSRDFLDALSLAEPFNEVLFRIRTHSLAAAAFGAGGKCLRIAADRFELKGFSGFSEFLPALNAGAEFEAIFSVEYDAYQKKSVGIIKSLTLLNSLRFEDIYVQNYLLRAKREIREVSPGQLQPAVNLIVLNSYEEYQRLSVEHDLSGFSVDFFKRRRPSGKAVLISPSEYLRSDISSEFPLPLRGADSLSALTFPVPQYMKRNVSRKNCATVFRELKKGVFGSVEKYYLSLGIEEIDFTAFLIILRIFEELGIVELKISPFKVMVLSGVKGRLEESVIYSALCEGQEE